VERRSLLQLILVAPILSLLERLGLRKKPSALVSTDEYVDFGPVKPLEFHPDTPFTFSCWFKSPKREGDRPTRAQATVQRSGWGSDGKWHYLVAPKRRS
jgi:hypothetical protein